MDKGAAAMIGAVVLAGGKGKRMQAGMNKQYLTVEGRSVLSCAIESMAAVAEALIVVAAKGEEDKAWNAIAESGVDKARVQVVEGGKERQDSVRHALAAMPETWERCSFTMVLVRLFPRTCLSAFSRQQRQALAWFQVFQSQIPLRELMHLDLLLRRRRGLSFALRRRRSVLWRRRFARCIWQWQTTARFSRMMQPSMNMAANGCAWWKVMP